MLAGNQDGHINASLGTVAVAACFDGGQFAKRIDTIHNTKQDLQDCNAEVQAWEVPD